MNELNINKGFEAMIPKPKQKEKKPQLKNFITFKLFKRRFNISIEVKEEDHDNGTV